MTDVWVVFDSEGRPASDNAYGATEDAAWWGASRGWTDMFKTAQISWGYTCKRMKLVPEDYVTMPRECYSLIASLCTHDRVHIHQSVDDEMRNKISKAIDDFRASGESE